METLSDDSVTFSTWWFRQGGGRLGVNSELTEPSSSAEEAAVDYVNSGLTTSPSASLNRLPKAAVTLCKHSIRRMGHCHRYFSLKLKQYKDKKNLD